MKFIIESVNHPVRKENKHENTEAFVRFAGLPGAVRMCGGCRVKVGGVLKYACVDGPDFDGHQVDFDELMKRNATYREQEKNHICNLTGGVR